MRLTVSAARRQYNGPAPILAGCRESAQTPAPRRIKVIGTGVCPQAECPHVRSPSAGGPADGLFVAHAASRPAGGDLELVRGNGRAPLTPPTSATGRSST